MPWLPSLSNPVLTNRPSTSTSLLSRARNSGFRITLEQGLDADALGRQQGRRACPFFLVVVRLVVGRPQHVKMLMYLAVRLIRCLFACRLGCWRNHQPLLTAEPPPSDDNTTTNAGAVYRMPSRSPAARRRTNKKASHNRATLPACQSRIAITLILLTSRDSIARRSRWRSPARRQAVLSIRPLPELWKYTLECDVDIPAFALA